MCVRDTQRTYVRGGVRNHFYFRACRWHFFQRRHTLPLSPLSFSLSPALIVPPSLFSRDFSHPEVRRDHKFVTRGRIPSSVNALAKRTRDSDFDRDRRARNAGPPKKGAEFAYGITNSSCVQRLRSLVVRSF